MTDSEQKFTDGEVALLHRLVDMIIPASDEYMLPSANEELIFADILRSAGAYQTTISGSLKALEQICREKFDHDFTELEANDRTVAVDSFRHDYQAGSDLIATVAAQCYYRDDRIMAALDMETRPPFPGGYSVDDGNWSLLDPVRNLSPIYRKVT
jgi:hypothetical protein